MSFNFSPASGHLFIGSILLLFITQIAVAQKPFSIKPAQSWVRTTTVSANEPNRANDSSSTRLLGEVQLKIGHNSVDRYYHLVTRVDNPSGLDDLSQLRFYFEPSYQKLTIHFLRIRRRDQALDVLRPSEIKMIQQEEELDQQLYNGTRAALIFVNDLRVGDTVDYAYTISGENPVMGSRFAETFYLSDSSPIKEFVLRLVCPTSRQLTVKNHNTNLQPTKKLVGEDMEYLWYQKDVAPVSREGSTPSWFSPYPRITVSEFHRWSDVVEWALPFYRLTAINDAELRAKVDEWKRASSQEESAVAALRFIQDQVRYLGIELGRYSHQPTAPQRVFARRFGDCKDKSLLLATVYNAMGIEAAPVLVNTYAHAAIDSWQPSPFAFDHVIVKATINGNTYWLDPTIRFQRGGLDRYYPPPYERALVLQTGSKELERIPIPSNTAGSVDVVEVYSRPNPSLPVNLTVTTTYRGSTADEMRYDLSTSSLADLGTTYLNFYADSTPSITADGLPVVEDDESTNTIVIKEKYSIAELWQDNKHRFLAEKIWTELEKPSVSQRTMPLRVRYPLSIRETILVDLGPGYSLPLGADFFADDALRFDYRYMKDGDQLRIECALQTFTDSVPVEKVKQHLAVLDKAQQFVGFELAKSNMAVVSFNESSGPSMLSWLAALVIVVGGAGFFFWLIRSRLRQSPTAKFAGKLKPRLGTSPEAALVVSSEEQLEAALRHYSCRCGHSPYDPSSPPTRDGLTFDGKRLVAINLMCKICRHTNNLYVDFESRGEPDRLVAGNELVKS